MIWEHCGREQPWREFATWELPGEHAGEVEVLSLANCEVCGSTRTVIVETKGTDHDVQRDPTEPAA